MNTTTEQVITLTESAAGQVKTLLTREPDAAGKQLRIYVEAGGCSGMQYGMVFDQERPGDQKATHHGVSVLLDEISANYLRGTVIDFVDSLNAGGFKLMNPNARHSCGCGKSFEA